MNDSESKWKNDDNKILNGPFRRVLNKIRPESESSISYSLSVHSVVIKLNITNKEFRIFIKNEKNLDVAEKTVPVKAATRLFYLKETRQLFTTMNVKVVKGFIFKKGDAKDVLYTS